MSCDSWSWESGRDRSGALPRPRGIRPAVRTIRPSAETRPTGGGVDSDFDDAAAQLWSPRFGQQISEFGPAGDHNADGFADFFISDWDDDDPTTYLFYGGPSLYRQ